MSRTYFLLWMILVPVFAGQAQQRREPGEKIIADLMERWIENTESTADYTDLQDQLEYFLRHKINLNKTNRFELEQLQLLDDAAISAILNHRKLFGDFLSVYELQTIEQLNERTLYYLSYFVTTDSDIFDDHTSLINRLRSGKHEVVVLADGDVEQRKGYESAFGGSPLRQAIRYRFAAGNKLMFGLAAENDAGEAYQPKGFDFYSAHLMVRNWGRVEALALGDYQVAFGQGLAFGSGMAPRKSAYVLNVRRNFQTIRPYRSLNETGFLRGAATTLRFGNFKYTVFGSYKPVSATLTQTASGELDGFSSLQTSGLHRTSTEMNNRNTVNETATGMHIAYQHTLFKLGITTTMVHYDRLQIPGTQWYRAFDQPTQTILNAGFDYEYQFRNLQIFGELAHSSNGGFASLTGLSASLHPTLDMVCLYRYYNQSFIAPYNNAFAEYSDGRNETGLYTGLSFKPSKRWVFNMYVDAYKSPWLRYLVHAPSVGTDFLSELQYNPSKHTQLYVRYHSEVKQANPSDMELHVNFPNPEQRQQIRFHIRYPMSATVTGNSRMEWVKFTDARGAQQYGSLIFQDFMFSSKLQRISFTGRFALFSIDDYDARIYANEADVLYQYSVPMYQNSGVRLAAVAHYRINKHLDGWIKCSRTTYSNVQTIGSGLDQITGNTLTEIKVQLRWRF